MSIAMGSINTGLPKDIVQQIMKAERIPINNMEARKGKIQDKKALVQQLSSLVEAMRGTLLQNGSARSLRELEVVGNDDIVEISADKNIAEPATYQFEVKQLAQKSSAMTSGFADPDESYIGVGFIQYTLPNGENKEIYIDADNASLKSVAKLINKNDDAGLRASVVNDGSGSDTPWRLILSLKDTGDINKADFPYFYFVDGEQDFYIEFEREAQDAIVALDGFEIELPENKAAELIPGVTIDLKKAKPGEEFTINISEDAGKVGEKINSLIEQINGVLSFIKQQNTMDENTDTSRTLGGDILLQSIESRIRNTIFKDIKVDGRTSRIGNIGIQFTREGLLEFDQEKFKSEMEKDYDHVAEVLTGRYEDGTKTNGFIDNLKETVGQLLQFPNGLLSSRKRSLDNNIETIDRRIAQRENMLQQKEKNLKDKFARLEGTMSRIKAQGAGLGGAPSPMG
ncbi:MULTISPECIES: flagellar filament capping protein FliD [Halobacteriovorax]|uniref:flagellar filament capping protein FliD n=1 Tax=Halobacteriovorax TaxID=1652133 RepID=UPI000EB65402|nr:MULTISPECIES: flagellar filament capping protein FliD [Halobacteriovorax]AYF43145.1 flagellar hook-associated protein 2 [Halobacteriovorax sp. BALOs_7]